MCAGGGVGFRKIALTVAAVDSASGGGENSAEGEWRDVLRSRP
jgi:hypothetical protein